MTCHVRRLLSLEDIMSRGVDEGKQSLDTKETTRELLSQRHFHFSCDPIWGLPSRQRMHWEMEDLLFKVLVVHNVPHFLRPSNEHVSSLSSSLQLRFSSQGNKSWGKTRVEEDIVKNVLWLLFWLSCFRHFFPRVSCVTHSSTCLPLKEWPIRKRWSVTGKKRCQRWPSFQERLPYPLDKKDHQWDQCKSLTVKSGETKESNLTLKLLLRTSSLRREIISSKMHNIFGMILPIFDLHFHAIISE